MRTHPTPGQWFIPDWRNATLADPSGKLVTGPTLSPGGWLKATVASGATNLGSQALAYRIDLGAALDGFSRYHDGPFACDVALELDPSDLPDATLDGWVGLGVGNYTGSGYVVSRLTASGGTYNGGQGRGGAMGAAAAGSALVRKLRSNVFNTHGNGLGAGVTHTLYSWVAVAVKADGTWVATYSPSVSGPDNSLGSSNKIELTAFWGRTLGTLGNFPAKFRIACCITPYAPAVVPL